MRARPGRGARPEFAFTREGRVFLLTTLGIGVAAVNTGHNLLYLVLGLMLGLLLTSGVLSEIVLRGVRIERGRPPRAFAGRRCLFELEATNAKSRLASTSFELVDVAEGEVEAGAYVLKLEPGETIRVTVERTPTRRGVLRSTHLRVRTRFPFGLLDKARLYEAPAETIVFPAIVPVTLPPMRAASAGFERTSRRVGSGAEIVGLREHREGDSLRDVHWRRSASLGRTVVRERAIDADEELVLELLRRDDEERFEAEVSRVASLALAAVDAMRGVVVRSEGGVLARASSAAELDGLLRTLALVDREAP